jgi:hypothetical protein
MAVRRATGTDRSKAAKATSDVVDPSDGVEQRVVALAEQLGGFLGTVRAKADGWLDREALLKEVGRIRDGAVDLLEQMNRAIPLARKAAAKSAAAAMARPSRGAVDAPGKRHRKPPPQERLDRHMGEPQGKQIGQKSMKNRMRSGRS